MAGESLPTLYEIYTKGGYSSGLKAEGDTFTLNDKPLQIISGTLHYFRVIPQYWEDRLMKMKACGLNAVDIYVPWNFHEEFPGMFNFTHGMKNITKFLSAVKNADMFVILRPGPYICAEWEFGGLPAWLLQDEQMKVRSNYEPYKKAVHRYFTQLASEIKAFQFHLNFGPVIAIQIENEFSAFGDTLQNPDDLEYMRFLRTTLLELGLKELFFTSDMPSQNILSGSLPGTLMTGNFQAEAERELSILKDQQQNQPLYVAEFWSGWFDHWQESHSIYPLKEYEDALKAILKTRASVNIYVFHGGTNFGFFNGANDSSSELETHYFPTCTSYDYDAPLTESGDYTSKYYATKEIIKNFCSDAYPKCMLPPVPAVSGKMSIKNIPVTESFSFSDILQFSKNIETNGLLSMEHVTINGDHGQNYGFILYRTYINCGGKLALHGGMADRAQIFLDNKEIAVWKWTDTCFELLIPSLEKTVALDILVENLGRVNFCSADKLNSQRKGLWGKLKLQDVELCKWKIYSLDFPEEFTSKIISLASDLEDKYAPFLHKIEFCINCEPKDTFLYSSTWKKGVAFVNGFNLGRYWNVGPQQTLYLPAHLLYEGSNCIYIFELHQNIKTIDLLDKPVLDILKES